MTILIKLIGIPVHRVEICYGFSRGTADPAYCHKGLHRDNCDNRNMVNATDITMPVIYIIMKYPVCFKYDWHFADFQELKKAKRFSMTVKLSSNKLLQAFPSVGDVTVTTENCYCGLR